MSNENDVVKDEVTQKPVDAPHNDEMPQIDVNSEEMVKKCYEKITCEVDSIYVKINDILLHKSALFPDMPSLLTVLAKIYGALNRIYNTVHHSDRRYYEHFENEISRIARTYKSIDDYIKLIGISKIMWHKDVEIVILTMITRAAASESCTSLSCCSSHIMPVWAYAMHADSVVDYAAHIYEKLSKKMYIDIDTIYGRAVFMLLKIRWGLRSMELCDFSHDIQEKTKSLALDILSIAVHYPTDIITNESGFQEVCNELFDYIKHEAMRHFETLDITRKPGIYKQLYNACARYMPIETNSDRKASMAITCLSLSHGGQVWSHIQDHMLDFISAEDNIELKSLGDKLIELTIDENSFGFVYAEDAIHRHYEQYTT